MGRKKKEETNEGVNFWEETEKMEAEQVAEVEETLEPDEIAEVNEAIGFTEDGEFVSEPAQDDIEEALELNRHPHIDDEKSEEDDNAIMTKSEARDYVEEQIDKDFMEDVAPVKLTPAQRLKKIASLEDDIKNAQARMSEIETIANIDVAGLRTMVEEVKKQVHGKVDDEDIKTSKDGIKSLEAVLLTEKIINGFKFQFDDKKSSIKNWEKEIIELKAGQLTIFDGGKADEVESETIDVVEEPETISA